MLFEERTTIFFGESSSVAVMYSGWAAGLNSSMLPESEILSPTAIELNILLEDEKTKRPLEMRGSPDGSPCKKNPSLGYKSLMRIRLRGAWRYSETYKYSGNNTGQIVDCLTDERRDECGSADVSDRDRSHQRRGGQQAKCPKLGPHFQNPYVGGAA